MTNPGLILLLLGFALFALPLSAAHAASTSTLQVTTTNTSGTTLTGYYTELYSSSGSVLKTGYSPHSFTLNDGVAYTVEVDGYQNCVFDHWSDTGSTDNQRSISISADTSIDAVLNCGGSSGGGGGTGSSVTVSSVDTSNNTLTGYYVALLDSSGSVLKSGYTTATFQTTSGTPYGIEADGYGSCNFAQWSDGVTNNPRSFTATSSPTSFTAVYNCGTSSGGGGGGTTTGWTTPGEHGGGPGTVTIYDHRIPASYWADCFATTCTNPQDPSCGSSCSGAGASMWVDLCADPYCDTVVASNFADENGFTFTGLTPGATYYLYPNDCDLCHGSTHDVLFSRWADGSSTNPLPVIANGTYYDAWYTCTNGCGGG